ncbi:MAG: BamA/TamA family outer membrane protein [Pseudomonadota bacterium]
MTPRLLISTVALCLGISAPTLSFGATARVFNDIIVEGNSRFSDRDILVTAGLRRGEAYGEQDLLEAIEDLEFTGEFDEVRIRSEGDRLIITVDETPRFEGQLVFGGGFDTDTGFFVGGALQIEDALGIGARINAELTLAEEIQTARFAVFDPDALSETVGLGVRFAYSNVEFDNVLFSYEDISLSPFVTFDLGRGRELEARIVFSETNLRDVDPSASAILQSEVGSENAVALGLTYKFGGVDPSADRFTWGVLLDAEYAFAGDADYIRAQVRGDIFLPIARGFALRSTAEAGHIAGLDDYIVRATDRFVLGGASLRGFERGTVTVRDIDGTVDTNLGGNSFAVIRTDLLVPLFPENPDVGTFVFADIGSVWELETDTAASGQLFDGFDLRASLGIGASYDFDFGRLEAYLAAPVEEATGDDDEIFGITFRTNF